MAALKKMAGDVLREIERAGLKLKDFYPATEIPDRVPAFNGGKLHKRTPFRWMDTGLRGVRLRHIRFGRKYMTCDRWLLEFFAATTDEHDPPPAPKRKKQREETALERHGLGTT